eukprot:TRINITY_DN63436_c0_g1_i1.p1 TRINITY_DN63436_c0_g1~~TRINITY_DN63436_c0_g1_i1.p1  ORF type:complete len:374 (-),score=51.35 TRINITY_DN63436_c0_g1_i1:135-1256(-)
MAASRQADVERTKVATYEEAVAGLLSTEWLAHRLWILLSAPQDLDARASCRTWSKVTTATPADGVRRLVVPHLSDTTNGHENARRFWKWAAKMVDPMALKSCQLAPSPTSHRELQTRESTDIAATQAQNVLSALATSGNTSWVDFVLNARFNFGIPDGSFPGSMQDTSPTFLTRSGTDLPIPWSAIILARPLSIAASKGHVSVVHLLLQARADVSSTDENNCTALHWAADSGRVGTCQALLAARADIDARDDDDWTSLCLAASDGRLPVCKFLVEAQADVNLPDEDGRSPLWWAAWKRHEPVVQVLLQARADLGQADSDGVAPRGLLLGADGRGNHDQRTAISWSLGELVAGASDLQASAVRPNASEQSSESS